ncbi:MAG TPA: ATP-grasp domain-containing protein [Planctomycetota bacterium]|nr:ATP-grasp domain-containing protein [Planctomycetota bacterium]
MIHVVFVAPFFGENMRHCLRCLLDLPDVQLGVITQEPEQRVPAGIRERLAAHYRVDDANDAQQLVTAARHVEQRWGRIDRLESYLEMLQVPVAEARDRLGLPGIGAEVARNFRDKNRMKEVLRAAGVPVARQALVHDAEDARRFAAEVGYPIVLKPLAGLGARNTQRATDEVSLASALNTLLPSRANPAQAEEFVSGEEHTFETVTIDGRSVWSSSVSYLPSPLQVLENAWMQYCLVMPREPDAEHVRAFAPINEKALAALGLRHGISHMEWFLRERGGPVVSEVGARPPGANIMPLLRAAHGADPWAAWARLIVHGAWELPPRQFAAGCVFLRAMGGGPVVRAVHGVEAMRARIGASIVELELPQPGQPRSTHYEGDGFVIVRAAATQGVVDAMREVLGNVRIV